MALGAACSETEEPTGTGGSGGEAGAGGAGGSGGASVMSVPADLEAMPTTSMCADLLDGESLRAVSPEGHAWLVHDSEDGQTIRVFDPFESAPSESRNLEVGSIAHLLAWSENDATVVASDGLFRIVDFERTSISSAVDPKNVHSICGDFHAHGILLADGALFELREDTWWTWDGLKSADDVPQSMGRYDGFCVSRENRMLTMGQNASVYELGPSSYTLTHLGPSNALLAATDGLVALLGDEQLHIKRNDSWTPYIFEAGIPSLLSASAERVWMASKDRVHRYADGDFERLEHPAKDDIVALQAHATGAWLQTTGQVCHLRTEPLIRVSGVQPHQRSKDSDFSITVRTSESSEAPTAALDDESFDLMLNGDTGSYEGTVTLPSVGWHVLTIDVAKSKRSIPLKRLPTVTRSWEQDISPLFDTYCADSSCHSEGSAPQPSLNTFEAWVKESQTITNRVIIQGSMPPENKQDEMWPDSKTIIAEWLEGGMQP